MLRRRAIIALAAICAAALVWWLVRPRPSDRELIERLVAKAEHGVEAKAVDEIMGCIAADYRDDAGLTKTEVWRFATSWARREGQAEVVIQGYEVDIEPPNATGRFDVEVFLTESGQQARPLRLDLTVSFERERRGLRKAWLVKSVSWPELPDEFEDLM